VILRELFVRFLSPQLLELRWERERLLKKNKRKEKKEKEEMKLPWQPRFLLFVFE